MNTLTGRKVMRTLIVTVILLSLAFSSLGSGQAQADDPNPPVTSMQVTPEPTAPPLPPNEPERGLIYDGLEVATDGPCKGLYRVVNTDLCTHGPDPAPEGVDIKQSVPPIDAALEPAMPLAQCDGDGTSGRRIQVLYARASDMPDRYNTYLASFRQWAEDMDAIFQQSAAETGGSRRVRFVHDASCIPIIPHVVVSPTGDDNWGNTASELQAQGYNRTDRKYVIFMDANVFCGQGGISNDDQPGSANANNGGPSYGRTDAGCWGGEVPAHELMHNLGGVQLSAPHTSGGWHCVDEYDRMCYSDKPYFPPMQYLCPDLAHDRLFDCNHDDYYSTNPPVDSYLATHWNAANSLYLIGGVPTPPDLVVESITFSPSSPVVGQPVAFTIRIKNQGTGTASPGSSYFVVDFYIDHQPTGCGDYGQPIGVVTSPLAPGATLDFTYTHVFTTEGTHQAWAFVDSGCQVAESDDGNNIAGPVDVAVGNDPDLIFRDGFDSCDLSRWSPNVTDSGDLRASPVAAFLGSCGMEAVIDSNGAIYVTDETPNAELRYRARFYFNPAPISMVDGNEHRIFYGYSGMSKVVLRLQFRRSSGNYQLRAGLLTDGSSWKSTGWFTINKNVWHPIELDWRASTGPGANNGGLTLWIDGVQKANLTAVDNDTWRIDRVRLGAVASIDDGTRGTYYFDEFVSRRQAYIGPAASELTLTDSPAPDVRPRATPTDEPLPEETPDPSDDLPSTEGDENSD